MKIRQFSVVLSLFLTVNIFSGSFQDINPKDYFRSKRAAKLQARRVGNIRNNRTNSFFYKKILFNSRAIKALDSLGSRDDTFGAFSLNSSDAGTGASLSLSEEDKKGESKSNTKPEIFLEGYSSAESSAVSLFDYIEPALIEKDENTQSSDNLLSEQQQRELSLLCASSKNETNDVVSLLFQNVDPDCHSLPLKMKSRLGGSPLCNAVKHGNVFLIQKLLDFGANPNSISKKLGKWVTPLLVAIQQSSINTFDTFIIRLLVQRGADINYVGSFWYQLGNRRVSIKLPSPLMLYAASNNKKKSIFNVLIACGADVNQKDLDGNTVLHYAAKRNKINLIHKLLNIGADHKVKNNKGELFLDAPGDLKDRKYVISKKNKIKSLKAKKSRALNQYKRNKNNNNKAKNQQKLPAKPGEKKVLSASQKKEQQDQRELMQASYDNKAEKVITLLTQGTDSECGLLSLNQKKKLGGSALCNAVEHANIQLVQKLLSFGANPNGIYPRLKKEGKGVSSDTPLRVAVRQFKQGAAYSNIVRMLVDHGANINLGGMGSDVKKSHTPLMLHAYIERPRKDIYKTLLDCGADLNKRDFQGNTALHIAAQTKKVKLVVKLLKSGARHDIKNVQGELFFDVGDKKRKQQLIALLKSYLASQKANKKMQPSKQFLANNKRNIKKVNSQGQKKSVQTKNLRNKNNAKSQSKKVKTKANVICSSNQKKKNASKLNTNKKMSVGRNGTQKKSVQLNQKNSVPNKIKSKKAKRRRRRRNKNKNKL